MGNPVVIGVCGSTVSGGNTEQFLKTALDASEKHGGVTEFIPLAGKNISDCCQCNWCFKKQTANQLCSIKDDAVSVLNKMILADVVLLASPVYFGRMTGVMASFIDRCRAFVFGATYEGAMRNKIGGALAVGWLRNSGLETALLTIHQSFLMLEMIPVSHHHSGVVFGAAGVSAPQEKGRASQASKLGILSDSYGLKGARALGKRAVDLAQIIKAGASYTAHES